MTDLPRLDITPPLPPFMALWRTLAAEIAPLAAHAFEEKFGKPIEVRSAFANDGSGRVEFDWRYQNEPNILRPHIQREWFAGFVGGYQLAVNLGMDLTIPPPESGAPN